MNDEPQPEERDPQEPANRTSRAYEARENGSLLRTSSALAKFAASAYWRSARWTVAASAGAAARVIRAASTGQSAGELLRSTREEIVDGARRALGVEARPPATPEEGTPEAIHTEREEARQPSVDVRAGWIPLKAASEMVAAGLSMIGPEAGCRHLDDVPAYLNNLFRLGLIWFSSEPLPDPLRYQVLEAQPSVAETMSTASRTRTVRRSIHLTPFGRDFCELCLPVDTGEFEALGSPPSSGGEGGEPDPGEEGNPPGRVDPSN
jgi:hypothetical protein